MLGLRHGDRVEYFVELVPFYPDMKEYVRDTRNAASAA